MTRFLYVNLKGRRLLVGGAVALTLVAVGADILVAFPLKFILDKIINHIDPQVPGFGSVITLLDQFGTRDGLKSKELHTQLGVILFSGGMVLALGVISAVVSFAQLGIAAFVAQDLGAKLRNRLFRHVANLPLEWHGRQRVGEVVQRINANITDIERLVTDGLVDLLSGILLIVGVLTVMLLINWQFTLVSMIIMPILALVVVKYTRWIKRASKQTSRANGEVAEVATEGIGAITELKAFTLENWLAGTFAGRVERRRRSAWRAGRRQAEFNPLVTTLVAFSTLAIITLGSWIASGSGHSFHLLLLVIPAGSLTIGSLTVFLTYSKQLYQPMKNLSKLMLVASNAATSAERIQEIFDESREEAPPIFEDWEYWDYVHTGASEFRSGYPGQEELTSPELHGDLAYRGVVFGYEEGRPVLHGVDLDVPVGRRVALVGLSGSGKTTLVRLLPRFYEPWQGTITIGGVDIRAYPRDLLRRNIGIVLQDSVLFQGTIRENILLDHQKATESEMVDAAKQACIHDTIMDLPGGYDAQVREHGKNFSSGQRQRIAIARAILRNAPILILDEPTANLDVEAEADVMRAIERLTKGRTVIVISHRLSTLGHVDQIAVLEGGRIVESGTYQELKANDGTFAHLLAEQNRYAAEPVPLMDTVPAAVASNGHDAVRVGSQSWPEPAKILSVPRPFEAQVETDALSEPVHWSNGTAENGSAAFHLNGAELNEEPAPARNPWWVCDEPGCSYSVYSTMQTELDFWRTKHMQVVHNTCAEGRNERSCAMGPD